MSDSPFLFSLCFQVTIQHPFDFFFFLSVDYGKISVRNVALDPSGNWAEICGFGEVLNPTYPGELTIHFPFSPPGDYWVLDTDYDNFASVYACTDVLGIVKIEFAWILVRDVDNISYNSINRALNAFKNQNLSTEYFQPVSQKGCTYENPSGADPCVPGRDWGN